MEQLRREAEQAERNYDLDRAAELRLGKIPDTERRLEAEEQRRRPSKAVRACCGRS